MNWLVNYLKGHSGITHGILAGLLGLGFASQLPFGQTFINNVVDKHPHIAPLVSMLVGIGFLLMNPKVQAKIESVTGIDLSVDEAKLQQSKENIQQVQQDLQQAKAQAAQATGKAPVTPPKS
jgi:thiol:disulfide interchange protein